MEFVTNPTNFCTKFQVRKPELQLIALFWELRNTTKRGEGMSDKLAVFLLASRLENVVSIQAHIARL